MQLLMLLHAAARAAAMDQLLVTLEEPPWHCHLASSKMAKYHIMLFRAPNCRQEVSRVVAPIVLCEATAGKILQPYGSDMNSHASKVCHGSKANPLGIMHIDQSYPVMLHLIFRWCCAANGLRLGTLVLVGNGAMPFLGSDLSPLTLSVQNIDQSILRVKIGGPGRWEVPQDRLFINTAQGMRTREDLQRFL